MLDTTHQPEINDLPELSDSETTLPPGAFTIADRIRTLVASQIFSIGGTDNRITLSLGIASTLAEQEAPNLIGRATQALIEGHARGQNRVEVATSD